MKNFLSLAAAILIAVLTQGNLLAQDPTGLEGTWEGFLKTSSVNEYRLVVRFEKGKEGGLQATVESPDVKTSPTVEFNVVAPKDGPLEFVSKSGERRFQGKHDSLNRQIVGEWKKGVVATPVTFAKLGGPAIPSEVWEGEIELPSGISLKVVFHLGQFKDGTPRGTMDSPDQGAYSIKLDSITRDNGAFNIAVKAIEGSFAGKLEPGGASAVGKWTQQGQAMPLTLKKVDKVTEAKRTQAPKPPFPYTTEDVAYASKAPGVRIAGTLTIPPGSGPFPAVLLISGSGPQDRDESLLGHKPFLVLADSLTRRGIAVLRVDDRGTGASTGDFAQATTFDFADDAQAGFEYLKSRKEIASGKIGLVGHSEGGLIAPIVASKTPEVGFIVLLAGPGLPGGEILIAQQALILKASGVADSKIGQVSAGLKRMIAVLQETPDPKAVAEKLKAISDELAATLPEPERKALAESDPNGASVARLTTPWFRTFILHDPRPTLGKVHSPVLALIGENDLQVPCKDNLDAITQALTSGGNTRFSVRALPGLNHLFQTSKTGAPSEYAKIEETFAPTALQIVGDWISEQTIPR